MNWGTLFGWGGALWSLAASIGYAFHKDLRQALYFFFAFCITITVVWR